MPQSSLEGETKVDCQVEHYLPFLQLAIDLLSAVSALGCIHEDLPCISYRENGHFKGI